MRSRQEDQSRAFVRYVAAMVVIMGYVLITAMLLENSEVGFAIGATKCSV